MFGSALLRRELAQDGARGFGFGIGCSGVILITRDGHRQVRIGRIGVGTVMVVTRTQINCSQEIQNSHIHPFYQSIECAQHEVLLPRHFDGLVPLAIGYTGVIIYPSA